MTLDEFPKFLSSPQPVLLFIAGQPYFKEQVLELCRQQVKEEARAFDWAQFDLDGLRADDLRRMAAEIGDAARTLPWLSERRWIYVQCADAAASALLEYVKSPAQRSVLVLEVSKKPAGWPKVAILETSGESDPHRWVQERVRKEGFHIDRDALQALIELVGDDLQRLSSELEKQFLFQLESRRITLDSVLGMSMETREFGIFNLIDALAERKTDNSLRILGRLFEAGMTAPQILSMLYWSFRRLLVASEQLSEGRVFTRVVSDLKLWSYKRKEREVRGFRKDRLADVLILLRQADRTCKTSSTDPRILLERLVVDTSQLGFL